MTKGIAIEIIDLVKRYPASIGRISGRHPPLIEVSDA